MAGQNLVNDDDIQKFCHENKTHKSTKMNDSVRPQLKILKRCLRNKQKLHGVMLVHRKNSAP